MMVTKKESLSEYTLGIMVSQQFAETEPWEHSSDIQKILVRCKSEDYGNGNPKVRCMVREMKRSCSEWIMFYDAFVTPPRITDEDFKLLSRGNGFAWCPVVQVSNVDSFLVTSMYMLLLYLAHHLGLLWFFKVGGPGKVFIVQNTESNRLFLEDIAYSIHEDQIIPSKLVPRLGFDTSPAENQLARFVRWTQLRQHEKFEFFLSCVLILVIILCSKLYFVLLYFFFFVSLVWSIVMLLFTNAVNISLFDFDCSILVSSYESKRLCLERIFLYL